MVTMMKQRLAMMADTNGMKELIESAIQDINTKFSYNTTTINDNYVLASLPEDCFYEVKSVSGTDHKWKAHVAKKGTCQRMDRCIIGAFIWLCQPCVPVLPLLLGFVFPIL